MRLTGRRADHLRRVLDVAPGRKLRAGVLGQGIGTGRVTAVDAVSVELVVEGIDPEADRVAAGPPVDLILAVPRPKALRRVLRLVATLGVRKLTLTNAWRVEKSYFASPVLAPEAIERELRLGAEQGGTARLPEVTIERLFVPFIERLEAEPPAGRRWVAHPAGEAIADTSLRTGAANDPRRPPCHWPRRRLDRRRARQLRPRRLPPRLPRPLGADQRGCRCRRARAGPPAADGAEGVGRRHHRPAVGSGGPRGAARMG